jgi:uncharacterized RDD family membrane protein YckC
MNLESNSAPKSNIVNVVDDIDFDFKPITSGLGFHTNKTSEIKPAFHESPLPKVNTLAKTTSPYALKETQTQVYQNDLALFYGREATNQTPTEQKKVEKVYRLATKSQRVLAYGLDLASILSFVGIVMTVMARLIHMDLLEVWSAYPNEITPLVITLFVGFYMIYFSIFEKTTQSTLGKNLVGITVVSLDNKAQSFMLLMLRSFISLANFISLGLFSYFDLQNKVSHSKVIKAD